MRTPKQRANDKLLGEYSRYKKVYREAAKSLRNRGLEMADAMFTFREYKTQRIAYTNTALSKIEEGKIRIDMGRDIERNRERIKEGKNMLKNPIRSLVNLQKYDISTKQARSIAKIINKANREAYENMEADSRGRRYNEDGELVKPPKNVSVNLIQKYGENWRSLIPEDVRIDMSQNYHDLRAAGMGSKEAARTVWYSFGGS